MVERVLLSSRPVAWPGALPETKWWCRTIDENSTLGFPRRLPSITPLQIVVAGSDPVSIDVSEGRLPSVGVMAKALARKHQIEYALLPGEMHD